MGNEKENGNNQIISCKRLKSQYRCEKTCNELNGLIKDATEYVEKKEDKGHTAPTSLIEEHVTLLINHLKEKTDLQIRLDKIETSNIFIYRSLLEILYELKNVEEKELFDSLMELLDLEFDKVREIKTKNYKFITLLNIKRFKTTFSGKKELEVYEKILNLFDIKRVSYEDYFDRDTPFTIRDRRKLTPNELFQGVLKQYDSTDGETIEFSVSAKDKKFAVSKANELLESFLGFILFIKHYFIKHYGFKMDEDDNSIDEIQDLSFFILKDENPVLEPYLSTHYKRMSIEKNMERKLYLTDFVDLNINRRIEFISHLTGMMGKIKEDSQKKELWKSLKEFLRLYYFACTERSLTYSFLQFWSLTETIIKNITGKVKDETLLHNMAKILKSRIKINTTTIHLKKRINYIYFKRNQIVHEGKLNQISEDDRVLAKQIADSVFSFYLDNLEVLHSFEEYRFILQNMNQDSSKLERYSELIDALIEEKQHIHIYKVINHLE